MKQLLPASVIALDIETTGLRPCARLTEIGAITSDVGALSDPWYVELSARDDESLRNALLALRVRIADATTVMHNAGFDLRELSGKAARLGVENPVRRALCTRRIAQHVLPGLNSYDLQSVAQAVGVRDRVEHRALADAVMTARVYEALRARG